MIRDDENDPNLIPSEPLTDTEIKEIEKLDKSTGLTHIQRYHIGWLVSTGWSIEVDEEENWLAIIPPENDHFLILENKPDPRKQSISWVEIDVVFELVDGIDCNCEIMLPNGEIVLFFYDKSIEDMKKISEYFNYCQKEIN